MCIMHSWYLHLNILKENFIIYVPNSFNFKTYLRIQINEFQGHTKAN